MSYTNFVVPFFLIFVNVCLMPLCVLAKDHWIAEQMPTNGSVDVNGRYGGV